MARRAGQQWVPLCCSLSLPLASVSIWRAGDTPTVTVWDNCIRDPSAGLRCYATACWQARAGVIVWQGPGLDAGLGLAGLTPLGGPTGVGAPALIGLITEEGWFLPHPFSPHSPLLLPTAALE